MWLAEVEINVESEYSDQIWIKPSWYYFMDEINQETYDKIDEIISKYKTKWYDTLSFIYRLRSNEELRTHFANTNDFSHEELSSLFSETFLPVQKQVEKTKQNTKKAATKIVELRNRQNAINDIINFLSWRTIMEEELVKRFEYISVKHYWISIEEFSKVLMTMNYDQQTKWLLKHTLGTSYIENVWKNLSKNFWVLDKKLWEVSIEKNKNT